MNEIVLTKENWETEVTNSDLPVLVDFWAVWCGPCRMIAPTVSEIASEYAGKIKVGKVNVDEQEELAVAYRIASIPTLMLFKDGKPVSSVLGYRPKEDIIKSLGL